MVHGRMEYGVAGKRTQDYGSNPFYSTNIAGGKVGILGSLISFLNLVRFQSGATAVV